MVVRKVCFSERRLFSNGLIRDDFKKEGKAPVRMERLTMERIVGAISLAIFLRTVVGLQCELGDLESKCEISNRVAGVKWKYMRRSRW